MVAKKKPGSGGNNKRRLAGKGPTPKAEDRTYHPAAKRKAAAATRAKSSTRRPKSDRDAHAPREQREYEVQDDVIVGRNPVLEALRAGIAVKRVMVARGVDIDERITEIVELARDARIEVIDINRKELDPYPAHQGVALRVAPYKFRPLSEVISKIQGVPLLVALDGVTDPRNIGAIARSAAAFSADGLLIPERRNASLTAAAWKTSAGAAARLPIAQITNLSRSIEDAKAYGCFIVGLDGDADTTVDAMEIADQPLYVIVGSEGKGLSRLVREKCDLLISIPMSSAVESLNASVAMSIALYAIDRKRNVL